jgi:hypothetical protein
VLALPAATLFSGTACEEEAIGLMGKENKRIRKYLAFYF